MKAQRRLRAFFALLTDPDQITERAAVGEELAQSSSI